MARRDEYESRVEKFLIPIMEENNFELVDVEYVKEAGTWYLRAYIDKEGGFTVDDCEMVSRRLSDWLDKEDFIDDSYILEVSSPGLGRPLKKEKDFKRSLGEAVDIKLYRAIERQKDFSGILTAYEADTWLPNLDKDPDWEVTADSDEQTYFDLCYEFRRYERTGKKALELGEV